MSRSKDRSRGLAYLRSVRPEALRHLLSFFSESARHLDRRTRLLISVVTKVISASPRGVRQYVRRALEAGATPDEVLDAILCAYPCAGLTRVVDAVDVVIDMDLPGFGEDDLRPPLAESPGEGLPGGPITGLGKRPLRQVVLEEGAQGWVEVARVSDFDAERDRLRVLAGGRDIALFCVDGKFLAVDNRCPHEGGPLSEGRLEEEVVACPLHLWRFDLRTGRPVGHRGASVEPRGVRVEGDRVLLRL